MAKLEVYHQLEITCGLHKYPIYIGHHLLSDQSLLNCYVHSSQVLIVTNETVSPLYLKQVKQAFSSVQCDTVVLPDGEMYKNHQNLMKIYDALIKHQHHRDTTIIALGGGVIGDLTGFAAATYQRGTRLIQIPTTLLAQVDSSVGGKTAINHTGGKNMIGSFYQPHAVIMDLNTLTTLPEREFRAGFAEIIKYGLLMGGKFLNELTVLLEEGLTSQSHHKLAQLIAHCCQIKASFVQKDERETGCRALLNLGHTFAHALEAYTHYQRWLHGEAVAIGLYCAALLSFQLGHLDQSVLYSIDRLLQIAKLPRRIPKEIDLKNLQLLMSADKKIKDNHLRFVLIRSPGDCYLDSTVTNDCLQKVLRDAGDSQ